ncbi:hypothetical protein H0H81_006047 [Sphagnurus paluster]|uniref:BHLH domain-containing protein n=1 Tax=Sphagnurus paluster TaxID=117069 RepID=A0A9P7GS35_9AGAR|nr:hypothetical protein H0H81_006047 [Sphagnurus paluster]
MAPQWTETEAITPDLGHHSGWDSHANHSYYSLPLRQPLHMPSSSSYTMHSMAPPSLASFSSILTQSESHAFNSFVPSQDWSEAPERQALAKATKDLMALDTHYDYGHYNQPFLPHPPSSDSSSRTPTPTSVSPFPRQPSRTRPQPYPTSTSPKPPQRRTSQPQIPPPQQKPALLSASQKKANHIQSEQKRRANIRRGYEALCECVPALREAIREEEEALAAANDGRNGSSAKRKGKVALKGKDGEEKVDGRAGPRSENVVLSKTIDYINEILDERSALLTRLHNARSALLPGHPALQYQPSYDSGEDPLPPWEREWKGGHGTLGNTCDGDGDESS